MGDSDGEGEITRLLLAIPSLEGGDERARERLFTAVYGELRRLARSLMKSERPGHTFQPTALVHEAYVRLVDDRNVRWENRAHFFGIAARAMRRLLVDHARERAARKRGGGLTRVTLDDSLEIVPPSSVEILDLDRAVERMAGVDERMARVVELRVFGGLTVPEVAHLLEVSTRTVNDDWAMARMWLGRELSGQTS